MPRDPGREELIKSSLAHTRGLSEKAISEKPMFGGWAYLLHGNLLIGARRGSLLLRVSATHHLGQWPRKFCQTSKANPAAPKTQVNAKSITICFRRSLSGKRRL